MDVIVISNNTGCVLYVLLTDTITHSFQYLCSFSLQLILAVTNRITLLLAVTIYIPHLHSKKNPITTALCKDIIIAIRFPSNRIY